MAGDTEHVQILFDCPEYNHSWVVGDATLTEELNRPFTFKLQLFTENMSAEPAQLLGKPCTITLIRGSINRDVMGIVTAVREGSTDTVRLSTTISVVPAFEAARHRVDTRIFQGATVPVILKEVIDAALKGFKRQCEDQTMRTYPECEYRTQYNESDLDFCHRLMEEEGIVYWFDFSGDKEKLVFADDKSKYGTITSLHGDMLLFSDHNPAVGGHEYVHDFNMRSRIRPTKVKTRHFDWTHSSAPFEQDSSAGEKAKNFPVGSRVEPARETYEHDQRFVTFHKYKDGPGAYEEQDQEVQTKLRRQAQAADAATGEGLSTVLGMTVARTFDLIGHLRSDLDGSYLVIAVTHTFTGEGDDHDYRNQFRCVPANADQNAEQPDVIWRPARVTPRPRVPSTQTATVVGEGGEEITTDKHGRIKVQFHWDRKGKMNDGSSCFIRVQQPWAGAKWGFLFVPRHKMEVVVNFIHGDPDRPVVTGCVYNAQNTPPYTLPAQKTKSTIKTRSSIGGGGFNELRFEDKKGSEEIYTHAQMNYDEVVLNDHTTDVGRDQRNEVHRNQKQVIDVNQDEHVKGKQTMTIGGDSGGDRDVHVKGKHTETIDKGHERKVTQGVIETIEGGESRDVAGGMFENIAGDRTQTITGASNEQINGALTQTVGDGMTIFTPQTYTINATGALNVTGSDGIVVHGKSQINITAPLIAVFDTDVVEFDWAKKSMVWNKITIVPYDVGNALIKLRVGAMKFDAFAMKKERGKKEIKRDLVKLAAYGMRMKDAVMGKRKNGAVGNRT